MENKKIIALDNDSQQALEPNVARKGWKARPLGLGTPAVVVSCRAYKEIGTDVAQVQTIALNQLAERGTAKIKIGDKITAALDFDDANTDIQTALQALNDLGSATVTGDFDEAGSVEMTMTGASGQQDKAELVENSLEYGGALDVQNVSFSAIPTTGKFFISTRRNVAQPKQTPIYKTAKLGPFDFDASNTDIQAVLRKHFNDAALGVTGDFENGFVVTHGKYRANGKMLIESDLKKPLKYISQEQLVEFDAVPDAGAFTLDTQEGETAAVGFDEGAAELQVALRDLEGVFSNCVVTGNFTNGFSIRVVNVEEQIEPITEGATNTLTESATPVVITITDDEEELVNALVTIAVVHAVVGSAFKPCTFLTTIDTEFDAAALNDSVSQGETLDKSDSGDKGAIYIASTGTLDVEVTEVF